MSSQKLTIKFIFPLLAILALSTFTYSQSGRRVVKPPPTVPEVKEPAPKPATVDEPPPVTAEKNQDYRCTEDGTLAHLLDPPSVSGLSEKEVEVKAEITAMPEPRYTPEARRLGIQGLVVLKLLLRADGKLDRVKVVKVVPVGLTENAIFAACEVKFKPAMKGGKPVAQWMKLEIPFLLAHSSIY